MQVDDIERIYRETIIRLGLVDMSFVLSPAEMRAELEKILKKEKEKVG